MSHLLAVRGGTPHARLRPVAIILSVVALLTAAACGGSGVDDDSATAPAVEELGSEQPTISDGELALPSGDRAVAEAIRLGTAELTVPLTAALTGPDAAGLFVALGPIARAHTAELRGLRADSDRGEEARLAAIADFVAIKRCARRVQSATANAEPDPSGALPVPEEVVAAVGTCREPTIDLFETYEGLTGNALRAPQIDLQPSDAE